MSTKNFALGKINFIIMGAAFAIIVLGFLLMMGPSTTLEGFEPDIFSARRIKLAPAVCFVGFIIMILGIIFPDKEKNSSSN